MGHPVLGSVELGIVYHPIPGVVQGDATVEIHQYMKSPTRQTFALFQPSRIINYSVKGNLMGHPVLYSVEVVIVHHPLPDVVVGNAL